MRPFAQVFVVFAALHDMRLPTKALDFVRTLDVPLAEVARSITRIHKPLRKMRFIVAQNTLVVVLAMLHFQDAVIVGEQARHQARACRRTDRAAGVGALKRHAALFEPFDVRRLAGMRGIDRCRLHAVENKEQKVRS